MRLGGESLMKNKNDLKLSDVMSRWYIWAVIGWGVGKNVSDTLGGLVGFAIAGFVGWYIQRCHDKKNNE